MKKILISMLIVGLIFSMTLVGIGCKEDSVSPGETTEEVTKETTEDATEETSDTSADTDGTITQADGMIVRSLDPIIMIAAQEGSLENAMYEGLTAYNKDNPGDPLPALAESWDVNEDATEWTFHLRKGVMFRSGNEMTSEDVLYSLLRGMKENSVRYPALANFIDPESGFEIVDDYTIKMTLNSGFAGWLALLSLPACGVLDKEELEKNITDEDPIGSAYLNDNSLGTGPFYLKEWAREERIVLERNDSYWGIEAGYHRVPKYKSLIFLNVPEATTRQLMIEKGDIDFTVQMPKDVVDQLEANDDVKVVKNIVMDGTCFLMNPNFEPFSDPNVVKAIQYGIDYDTIINDVVSGVRFDGPLFTPMIGTDDNYEYYYDLEMAKQFIAKSNYPDGFEFDYFLAADIYLGVDSETLAVQIQSDLAQLGLTANIEIYDWSVMDEKLLGGNYDVEQIYYGPMFADPEGAISLFGRSDSVVMGVIGKTYPEIDELADQGMIEIDPVKRAEIYQELSKKFAEQYPAAFVAQSIQNFVFRSDVSGFDGNPDVYSMDYAVFYRE